MDFKRLRTITIIAPIAYLLGIELLAIFLFRPMIGSPVPRLLIIFAVLAIGVVPFSFWVFATIERQQRDLQQAATFLESVQDYAIFMLDPAGRVISWSPGAERVKGYSSQEILGEHVSCFYPPEERERGRPDAILREAAAAGRAIDEGWHLRKDGTRFWAHVTSSAVRDKQGALLGFTHVVRDMTEAREAGERIRALNQELEQRVRELAAAKDEVEQRNRELAAVNTAIVSISGALDVSQVLQTIADAAREVVGSKYAALGVADQTGRITQFITSGISPEQRAAIGPPPRGHGLLGALIKEGKPLRIPDIAQDPRRHGFPPHHPPMKSLLGVPILYQGQPVGDLYLTDKVGADEFSREDQDLLLLLANHAAVAIQNARLYEEVRAARDRLQVWNAELEAKVAERTREVKRYSRELTTRVLQAQEEERKRIARELHDETAQSLSTLLITLDLCEPHLPPDDPVLRASFDRLRTITRRTLDETRALSHDLRPTILDDAGLIAALHWFAEEYTRTFGVPVEVRVGHAPRNRLSAELELALFRIAQEALTNSGKYARATSASVDLEFSDGVARLVVQDNGKGFDRAKIAGPTRQGGLGLYGMQERAALVGGRLTVDSVLGEGTTVTAVVPLHRDPTDEEPTAGVASREGAAPC